MAIQGKKRSRKSSYEGYTSILIDDRTLNTAYAAMDSDLNLWEWVDSKKLKGYEFSFELETDTGYSLCVMKAVEPAMQDAGIYMFTTATNTLDSLILTWYKHERLAGGLPFVKSTPKTKSVYR